MHTLTPTPELPPALCDGCGRPAHLQPRAFYVRRGERVLAVPSWTWVCDTCVDPFTGERPYSFADSALMQWHEARARSLWEAHFQEPMPPSQRGRRPGPSRVVRVPVLLTPEEAELLDRQRGELSRSEFLRQAIRRAG